MTPRARTLGVGVALALAAFVLTSSMGAAQGGTLQVTATYQGNGEVGPNNAIWLAVWDTPNIPPDGSVLPIGGAQVTENGGAATITGLSASTVYLTVRTRTARRAPSRSARARLSRSSSCSPTPSACHNLRIPQSPD